MNAAAAHFVPCPRCGEARISHRVLCGVRLLQGPHGRREAAGRDDLGRRPVACLRRKALDLVRHDRSGSGFGSPWNAMGADGAPRVEVEGALAALASPTTDVVLVGDEATCAPLPRRAWPAAVPAGRIQVRHAAEVVGMDEAPATAFRQKKASSMRVCFDLAQAGEVDAVVLGGQFRCDDGWGALGVGADRRGGTAAIVTTFPTQTGQCALLDMGRTWMSGRRCLGPSSLRARCGVCASCCTERRDRGSDCCPTAPRGTKGTALTREAHQLLIRRGPRPDGRL